MAENHWSKQGCSQRRLQRPRNVTHAEANSFGIHLGVYLVQLKIGSGCSPQQ